MPSYNRFSPSGNPTTLPLSLSLFPSFLSLLSLRLSEPGTILYPVSNLLGPSNCKASIVARREEERVLGSTDVQDWERRERMRVEGRGREGSVGEEVELWWTVLG